MLLKKKGAHHVVQAREVDVRFGVLACGAVLTLSGRVSASPFQNGSFESVSSPTPTDSTIYLAASGWSVNYNGVPPTPFPNVCFSTDEGATDGTKAVIFDAGATNGIGQVYQSFSTNPGQTYAVNFDYGQFGYQHAGVSSSIQVDVRAGASATAGAMLINPNATFGASPFKGGQVSLTDSAGRLTIGDSAGDYNPEYSPAPNTEFSRFSFTFTAQSNTSTIAFTDLSGTNVDANDGLLDNVQIPAAVPEPTSFSTVLLGALSLCRRRTR